MDQATREALLGSIAKWQGVVDGTGMDKGASNCPLCAMFNDVCSEGTDDEDDPNCVGCPVFASSGQRYCLGTPYSAYVRATNKRVNEPRKLEVTAAAQAELDFLKSLLTWEDEL